MSWIWIFLVLLVAVASGDLRFEAAFQGRCSGSVPCEQTCVDLSNGAYECGCREGFVLLPDGYSCQGRLEYEANLIHNAQLQGDIFDLAHNDSFVRYNGDLERQGEGKEPEPCTLPCGAGKCVREGPSYESTERCQCPFGLIGETCSLPAMLSNSVRFRNSEVSSDSHVSFPPLVGAYKNLRITLELRAESWDGVILLTGEKEDLEGITSLLFLKEDLSNSVISYHVIAGTYSPLRGGTTDAGIMFDCGSGAGLLRSGQPIKLHEWTKIRIDRHGRDARLWVQHDGVTKARAQGVFSRITFRQPVYLGGVGNMTSAKAKLSIGKGFHGCVRNFEVNDYKYDLGLDTASGWDVEPCTTDLCVHAPCLHGGQCVESPQSRDVATCLCPLGYSGELCETQVDLQVPSLNGSSYLKYAPLGKQGSLYFQIKVTIKPKQPTGLVWYTGNAYLGDFAALRLKDGYVVFTMDLGDGLLSIRSHMQLELEEWHDIEILRTGKQALLRVKGQPEVEGETYGAYVQMTLTEQVYVGGLPTDVLPSVVLGDVNGYSGCIQQLSINDVEIPMVAAALSGVNIDNCNHPCASSPCGDRGRCKPDQDEFLCDCRFGWGGSQCQYKLDEISLETPMFVGRSYLHYTAKDISERIRGSQLSVSLRFRTESPNGLILWAGRKVGVSSSDFFSISVEKRKLHFRFSLGREEADVVNPVIDVSDGRWHHVLVLRTDQQGWLIVDEGQTYTGYSEGRLRRLDVNSGLYLAHPKLTTVESWNGRKSYFKDINPLIVQGSRNSIVIGDDNGYFHFLDRALQISSHRFYTTSVNLLSQVQSSSLIITVGEDDEAGPAILKVWDLERGNSEKKPVCIHSTKLPPGKPCAVAVKEDLNAVACGFQNGSVVLLTGDFSRSRPAKLKVVFEGKSPITSLAWKELTRDPCLFITTQNEVFCYGSVGKEKDKLVLCDSIGCNVGCSVLGDLKNETMLFIAREDAIYSFTGGADSRGTCYFFDGEKKLTQWYRGYLVVVVKDEPASIVGISDHIEKNIIYVVDLNARSIVFSTTTSPVANVFQAYGSLYVYTIDDRLLELREKDLQSKLEILFKKNLYDVAISIAKAQQYDPDSLAELFRQYGDHLYKKGDHSNAMEQYVKTIGRLEPSYVIRRYLDSPRILSLTLYLEALHKERLASEDHTTLLINCYAKLRDSSKLNAFLSKDMRLGYDVETAIKICRHGGYIEEALAVARAHGRYDAALKILIEDKGDYDSAIEYIRTLDAEQVESSLRQYGSVLLNQLPDVTTKLVTDLCVKFQLAGDETLGIPCVEDFLPIFAARPERLSEFLEEVLKHLTSPPVTLFHTLLENYLLALSCESDAQNRKVIEEKALRLLDDSNVKLRLDQALIACQSTNFTKGVLLLYEKAKLYGQILAHHLKSESWEKAVSTCRRFGTVDPSLWVRLLRECVQKPEAPSYCMTEALNAVEKDHLMSPLLVIELLCKSHTVELGKTREFLLRMLVSEESSREEDEKIIENLREECKKVRSQIRELQESAIVFQGSKCSVCSQPLDMPSVHFLCQHSFHQRCFDSYAENDSECIVCLPANKKIREQLKALEPSPNVDAFFMKQLSEAEDCFSVVAEYFGKGLFTPSPPPVSKQVKAVADLGSQRDSWEGSVSEARLRIQDRQATIAARPGEMPEGKTRLVETVSAIHPQMTEGRIRLNKAASMIPVAESEGRMRLRDRSSPFGTASESKAIPEHIGSYDRKRYTTPYAVTSSPQHGGERQRTISGSLPSSSGFPQKTDSPKQRPKQISPISPTNPFADDTPANPFEDSDDKNPFAEPANPFHGSDASEECKNPFEDE